MTTENKTVELVTYKMFDENFKCRDFQYVVGETYKTDTVEACSSGFHACEFPLDCFNYYSPATSKFAEVVQSGEISKHDDDSKVASGEIYIKVELSLPQFIGKAVAYILSKIDWDNAAATNTGYYSAATNTGDRSAATNTGYYSAATNTGYRSAATNTGYQSAATNTGDQSAATNTGYYSAATVSGKYSVALSSGVEGKAKASTGSAIVLVYRNQYSGEILHIKAAIAGKDVEPDVFYTLDENGNFVKTEEK